MSTTLSPSNISELIDTILTTPDPAVIGLRRILKSKQAAVNSFGCQPIGYDEFHQDNEPALKLSEDDRHVLELEKQVATLRAQLDAEKKRTRDTANSAYQKGLTEGNAQGHQEGQCAAEKVFNERLGRIQEIVRKSVEKIALAHNRVLSDAHHMILKMSLALAQKIVAEDLKLSPDHILAVVKRTLTFVADRERIVIRVAPSLCETVLNNKTLWTPDGDQQSTISVIADPSIESGGCIVESNSGCADARLGVAFAELTELVEKFWENLDVASTPQE
jgi:flagellar assembly protein FliH